METNTSIAGVGIVVVGALFLGQRVDWKKLLCIAIVIGGVIGLQLTGAFEVGYALSVNGSEGFTTLSWSLVAVSL